MKNHESRIKQIITFFIDLLKDSNRGCKFITTLLLISLSCYIATVIISDIENIGKEIIFTDLIIGYYVVDFCIFTALAVISSIILFKDFMNLGLLNKNYEKGILFGLFEGIYQGVKFGIVGILAIIMCVLPAALLTDNNVALVLGGILGSISMGAIGGLLIGLALGLVWELRNNKKTVLS